MGNKNVFVRLGGLFAKLWEALKSHPVELLVLLHAAVAAVVNKQELVLLPAKYALFATVAALCLSFHRRGGVWWQVAYWAVLPLYALTALLPAAWPVTTEFAILNALMPLVYLLTRRTLDDGRFSSRFFSMVRSGAIALGVGMVVCFLLMLIEHSVQMLFGYDFIVSYIDIYRYILSFSFILLAPMLFIGLESSEADPEATRLEEALVNWVLTPALLIYNLILYIYLIYIMVNWELPKGSVATMVSVFVMVAAAVVWLRPRLSRQPMGWYFRWFPLFALPLAALYWVAVGYRIGQYGMTVDRCVLLAVGVVMTVWLALSLFRMKHLGFGTCALMVLLGLVLAFGGPLSARQVSLRSQLATVRHHAGAMGLLDADGRIADFVRNDADSTGIADHRAVYQAMKYVQNELHDTVALQRELGMTPDLYLERLSPATAAYAKAWTIERDDPVIEPVMDYGNGVSLKCDTATVDISGYSSMIVWQYISGDSIPVPGGSLAASEVLEAQLAKIGYNTRSNLDRDRIERNSDALCHYTSPDGSLQVVFDNFWIEKRGDTNYIESGRVRYALRK